MRSVHLARPAATEPDQPHASWNTDHEYSPLPSVEELASTARAKYQRACLVASSATASQLLAALCHVCPVHKGVRAYTTDDVHWRCSVGCYSTVAKLQRFVLEQPVALYALAENARRAA